MLPIYCLLNYLKVVFHFKEREGINMSHEYTRQRQGRDFTEDQKNNDDRKSMIERLDRFKEEAERNVKSIDGNEPPERVGSTHGY